MSTKIDQEIVKLQGNVHDHQRKVNIHDRRVINAHVNAVDQEIGDPGPAADDLVLGSNVAADPKKTAGDPDHVRSDQDLGIGVDGPDLGRLRRHRGCPATSS